MKIVWSPLAIERVSEIARYIANDNPIAADKWINAIFKTVEKLEIFPESGRYVQEIHRKDIREVIYGNYRIIYKVSPDEVSILTVRHGKQILLEKEVV